MKLPSAEDFLLIVEQKGFGSLATLNKYRFLSDENKPIWFHKSRHAVVFKAEFNKKSYALRFFLNDDVELFRRYQENEEYLEKINVSWKVPFHFMKEEFYPAVKMDWIEGLSLAEYIDLIISQPFLINQLQSKLVSLSRDLEGHKIGHGNLNLNHIRLAKHGQDYAIKLIDYDSMFIPLFADRDSLSAGTSSFQHPMRLTSDFSETIDRFSFWVLLTALEAFKHDPSLWKQAEDFGYNKSRQILFNYRDLASPQQSVTFQTIRNYKNSELNFYADKLFQFCTLKSLSNIEAPRLYHSNNRVPGRESVVHQIRNNVHADNKETEPIAPLIQRSSLKERTETLHLAEQVNEIVEPRPVSKAHRQRTFAPEKKKKGNRYIVLIAALVLLGSSVYLFILKNQKTEISIKADAANKKAAPLTTKSPVTETPIKETVFAPANLTQFLFGLYQSYNKRDLQLILSNYSDSLEQYYDAKAVTKDKLKTIITDLFIKPAYYECQPDLRTLQFSVQQNICKLSVGVTETIKADQRSKSENYTSKIEYLVDSSFKIISEKNVD